MRFFQFFNTASIQFRGLSSLKKSKKNLKKAQNSSNKENFEIQQQPI